jgi:PAS domain-containing protein
VDDASLAIHALQESKSLEARHRHLMEQASDATLVLQPPRILEANRRAAVVLSILYEYRFRRRDGRYRWFRDETRVGPGRAGTPSEADRSWKRPGMAYQRRPSCVLAPC